MQNEDHKSMKHSSIHVSNGISYRIMFQVCFGLKDPRYKYLAQYFAMIIEKIGSMDVNFILLYFNPSTQIHFLVFQRDRKTDEISKRCMNQAYCLIKVRNTFIDKNIITSCVKSSYFCLVVVTWKISYSKMYLKNP